MTRQELLETKIANVSEDIADTIKRKFDILSMPIDGLGKFEDIVCKIGKAQNSENPDISKRALIVMCSDNDIFEEGVSKAVNGNSYSVAEKLSNGNSAGCLIAQATNVDIKAVNIGIKDEIKGLIDLKVSDGSKNFLKEPAMTEEAALKAIEAGIKLTKSLKDEGYNVICAGEMGVGNTTNAAALICAILDGDPEALTGIGTGNSEEGLRKKINVICEGLHKYGYDRDDISYSGLMSAEFDDAVSHSNERVFEMLCNLGGLDIAGLVGIYIGAAINSIPVVIDGIVSAAAALTAESIIPGCVDFMIGSHDGREPAIELAFGNMGIDTVLDAKLSVGEGAGAMMLLRMTDMALRVLYDLK